MDPTNDVPRSETSSERTERIWNESRLKTRAILLRKFPELEKDFDAIDARYSGHASAGIARS